MRLYYKTTMDNEKEEHYIDVPNKDVEEIKRIIKVYNYNTRLVYGVEKVKITREEYNIFNYGKAKEEKETTN